MDVRHNHGTDVFVVRACHHDDGADLLALGGTHSVQVLLTVSSTSLASRVRILTLFRQTPTSAQVIANFHVGSRITTLAWSSISTSPSRTDEWTVEYALAFFDTCHGGLAAH